MLSMLEDLLEVVQKARLARRRNVHRFISFAGIFPDSTPPSSIMESQRHFEKVNSPVISSSYWKDVKNVVWSHNSWQMTIITFSWQIQSQAQLINSHLVRPLLTKDFLWATKLICEGHFNADVGLLACVNIIDTLQQLQKWKWQTKE